MSTSNLAAVLQRQLTGPVLQVGTVVAGTTSAWVVELPGGGRIIARGEASLSQRVWVRGGVIEGTAPTLPTAPVDI